MSYLDRIINKYSCTSEPPTPYHEREDADKVKEDQIEKVGRKAPKKAKELCECGGSGCHPMKNLPCPKCGGTGVKED